MAGLREDIRPIGIETDWATRSNPGSDPQAKIRKPKGRFLLSGALLTQGEAGQRSTRAEAPFITFSTSSRVAIEVSPGVVMASAP